MNVRTNNVSGHLCVWPSKRPNVTYFVTLLQALPEVMKAASVLGLRSVAAHA
jgi:hypothetical protein